MNPRAIVVLACGALIGVMSSCQAQQPAPAAFAPPEIPLAPAPPGARPVGFPQYPAISPDGQVVVFSYAGDLWAVDAAGGVARRLTAHPSDDLRSAFSPDGAMLAFESERDGPRSIYLMPLARTPGGIVPGEVRRVTTLDRSHTLAGFSADGSHVLFYSGHEPAIFRGSRMYRAPVSAKGPIERLTDAFGAGPRMTLDGSGVLFYRGRFDSTRPRYVGPAACDVYRLAPATGAFSRLTAHAANDADPFPLPDGSVVFVSSRSGQNNLWRLPPGATDDRTAQQLTFFAPDEGEATIGHGVRDLDVSPNGWHAVFAVWDTLHVMDLRGARPQARAVSVLIAGDFAQLDESHLNIGKQVNEAALSPDGKTVAVIARGEVFVRSTDKDRPTRRVTDTHARERDLAWSPDGRTLYFSSDLSGAYGIYTATVALSREDLKGGEKAPAQADPKPADPAPPADPPAENQPGAEPTPAPGEQPSPEAPKPEPAAKDARKEKKPDYGKRWAESITFNVEPFLVGDVDHRSPTPSPDGTKLLVTRGLGDLMLIDLATRTERILVESWNEPDAAWAPDSRHVIYEVADVYFNSDIWVLDTAAEDLRPVNLTRHPDNDHSPRLSGDGKVLVFLSDRNADSNGQFDLFAVNLDRALDGMRPYELADYFKEAADKAKKRKPLGTEDKPAPIEPMKLDADDAYLRVRQLLSMPGSMGNLAITPGGERVIFSASVDGTAGLYSVDYRGQERKTVQSGGVSRVSVSLTGDKIVFVTGGDAASGRPAGGETERWAINAPVTIRIEEQQRQKFLEAARLLGTRFYHPTLKGLNWAALTDRYLSLAMKTRTDPEFNRVVMHLFGELDGSHLGIGGGRDTSGSGQPFGYLGVDASPVGDGWRVERVIPHSPADRENSRLNAGDVILAVNGTAVSEGQGPTMDLARALSGTSGQETLLRVRRAGAADDAHVLITPISSGADNSLRYDDEVLRRAALVDRLSNGRLGYLHIRSMDIGSVRDFERDLYAAAHGRDGLIIDVRDNGGGWTTDILLASLTAPRHAYTAARGVDPLTVPKDAYPRDRRLIYAYNRPISVLINQNSFSNAEIFPHSIKTIGRGKLVGTETFGAVISTGGTSLIDGSFVRLPFRGWYLPDGTDMENHGARPDIEVPVLPEHEVEGRDPQIEAAITELLERCDKEPFWSWGGQPANPRDGP